MSIYDSLICLCTILKHEAFGYLGKTVAFHIGLMQKVRYLYKLNNASMS